MYNQIFINFLAYRIISGALDYEYAVMKRPDLKEGIDISLQEKQSEHLIKDIENK